MEKYEYVFFYAQIIRDFCHKSLVVDKLKVAIVDPRKSNRITMYLREEIKRQNSGLRELVLSLDRQISEI